MACSVESDENGSLRIDVTRCHSMNEIALCSRASELGWRRISSSVNQNVKRVE